MASTATCLSYRERAELATHPVAKSLFTLMVEKESNLCVAADLTNSEDLLQLADTIGSSICVLKTHIDILTDFNPMVISELKRLAKEHSFLIFEDRKFADIGNTVVHQYRGGIYQIADWAHITNAHSVPGPGIIEGLSSVGQPNGNALLLLAEMSSQGTLAKESYTENTIEMAKKYRDFVIGFITTKKLTDDPTFIHFTPGVKKAKGTDRLGQQYLTPEIAIKERGTDIIIVGRGIYQSKYPKDEAELYRSLGWSTHG